MIFLTPNIYRNWISHKQEWLGYVGEEGILQMCRIPNVTSLQVTLKNRVSELCYSDGLECKEQENLLHLTKFECKELLF